MSGPPLAVFCDFDGTVAKRDVGYNLFHHFSNGRTDALLPDWKAGRLSTRDCLRLEAEMVTATRDQIVSFVDQFELDETFPTFVEFCRARRIPLTILSEGMDLYINRLLEKNGLSDVPVHCNRGLFVDGRLKIDFPYTERTCEGCGNCKAARMIEFRRHLGPEDRLVFVGDGYSDACGASEADIIFAKKDLERYCQSDGISYYSFRNFDDVTAQLRRRELPAS
jgi:2,3-diketo-5-methylthio-1-phosphopentane phosphatase